MLVRCFDVKESDEIMLEVRDGVLGLHKSGYTLARKILRMGYYWSAMKNDCFKSIRKCQLWQLYVNKIHQLLVPLHNLTSSWSFSIWDIDTIRMIYSKASNAHRFILAAIN